MGSISSGEKVSPRRACSSGEENPDISERCHGLGEPGVVNLIVMSVSNFIFWGMGGGRGASEAWLCASLFIFCARNIVGPIYDRCLGGCFSIIFSMFRGRDDFLPRNMTADFSTRSRNGAIKNRPHVTWKNLARELFPVLFLLEEGHEIPKFEGRNSNKKGQRSVEKA